MQAAQRKQAPGVFDEGVIGVQCLDGLLVAALHEAHLAADGGLTETPQVGFDNRRKLWIAAAGLGIAHLHNRLAAVGHLNHPGHAAVAALNGDQSFVGESVKVYKQRRDRCLELINAIDGLSCIQPKGAFYLYVNCAALIGKTTPSGSVLEADTDVVLYLLESQGVAVVAGTAYGLAPFFRMSTATAFETLETGCTRIATAVAALR